MQISYRKCSQQMTHKNRNEILYYISQIKMQVYSHCVIAYDTRTFFVNQHQNILDQLLHGQQIKKHKKSSSSQEDSAQKNHQAQEMQLKIKKSIIGKNLHKMQINRRIVQKPDKRSSKARNQQSYSNLLQQDDDFQEYDQTQQEASQKIIYFNNSDIAFYVDERQKKIQLYNLASKTLQLNFTVPSSDALVTIQSILRKKVCELGFYQKYKIFKLLGKGASAKVHLAERISDKKTFAAKIISTIDTEEKNFEIFVNQAKLLRLLRHKNIINLESVYVHNNELIQVLQYLPGGNLLEFLKTNSSMSTKQKWLILKDITQALEYLRKRSIVHRDLKLQNIMVRLTSHSKQFVVSDFGLASWTGESRPVYEKCGTPGYIDPEILNIPTKSILLDHRSDIFSLGVIAHILFLFEPLFFYQGNLKDLIELNKKAKFNLNSTKYICLKGDEKRFLQITLAVKMKQRVTSEELMKFLDHVAQDSQRQSQAKVPRKQSFNEGSLGIEVKVKKDLSLRKKNIKIEIQEQKKNERGEKTEEKRQRHKSMVGSARKMLTDLWDIISPQKKIDSRLKLKQNSMQKHRKNSDFFGKD